MEKSISVINISNPKDVAHLVASALVIVLNAYTCLLVWWSSEWPRVFAVAFAGSTLLEVSTPWGQRHAPSNYHPRVHIIENNLASACVVCVIYTFPALLVALFKIRTVAIVASPVWIAMAARRIFEGHNRQTPFLAPSKFFLELQ